MTPTEKLKLKTTIQLFGGTAVNLGYKLAKSGKLDMSPSMLLELEDAMVPLVLQYNELLQSREDYQKAADAMAAEHKVERDKLVDALVQCRDAFEPPESGSATESLWNDAMYSEDGIPDYVVASVSDLRSKSDVYRSDAIRNAKLAVKYREQLQKATPKLPLEYDQIEQSKHEWLDSPVNNDSAFHAAVKFAEKYHGIGGDE